MNKSLELYDLNDDCLREVFSRLPDIDLCAAKSTCNRFESIAYEVAGKRFKKHLYECEPNEDSLKEHATILESFGEFISTMSLRMCHRQGSDGPRMEADEIFPLLDHCPSLVGLYLIEMGVEKYPIGDWCNNLRLLKFNRCTDQNTERWKIASVLSACKRLEVFGYMHENRFGNEFGWDCRRYHPPKGLLRESPTIKHLHIDGPYHGHRRVCLPTPEDMAKLFTLQLKGDRGHLQNSIRALSKYNAPLMNLVLLIPEQTECFRLIAEFLNDWTNLMSYNIYTGFRLSDCIFKYLPNLIYVGRSDYPREFLLTHRNCHPQYIYEYEWTRDAGRLQDGSDSESLFQDFRAWKANMKDLGLHVEAI